MARLVSMLLRAARDSFPASRAAGSAAAGAGLIRRSCPIAAFRPQRGIAGEDASSEHSQMDCAAEDASSEHPQMGCAAEDASSGHMLLRRSPHADPRLPFDNVHGIDFSLGQHGADEIDDEFVATEKDMASDEAMWALYKRWCEYFKVERDHDEMLEITEYADMECMKGLTDEDFELYKAQGLVDESHLE
ncbi:unnamed protein product [Urochloa humidicola]